MAAKIKPCLGGKKHIWKFVRNANTSRSYGGALGTTVHMSVKGVYKCQGCDLYKYGPMDHNEPNADLRDQLKAA